MNLSTADRKPDFPSGGPCRSVAAAADSSLAPRHAAGEMDLPHVLIIVTSYNYAPYVVRALRSVAAQTYPNWSCVVVDDNSPDESCAVIADWLAEQEDNRFQLVRKSHNEGQLAAIATGLAASPAGQFVALLDSDDLWFPTHLDTHVSAHLSRQDCAAFSCSNMQKIDAEDRVLPGIVRAPGFRRSTRRPGAVPFTVAPVPGLLRDGTLPGAIFLKPDLFRWHWTMTSGMMFRRAMLALAMPRQMPLGRLCPDHYLAHFCHFFTGSILLDAQLGVHRRHGRNASSSTPVLGTQVIRSMSYNEWHNRANLDTMLTHALDRHDDLATVFGARRVRTLISFLAGRQLWMKGRLEDPRARAMLGIMGRLRALGRERLKRLTQ